MLNNPINLNSLEIQQARIKFILFKSKLRSILYGGTLDDSVASPRENPLGQWLYAGALSKYNYIAEMREMERLNKTISGLAAELLSLYRRGKIEEARAGLGNLDASEAELGRLLEIINHKSAA